MNMINTQKKLFVCVCVILSDFRFFFLSKNVSKVSTENLTSMHLLKLYSQKMVSEVFK